MEKKQILNKIAEQEYNWLKSLTISQFVAEYNQWFNLDEQNALTEDDDTLEESLPELRQDYVEDFMRYREDESEEELIKLIN